MQAREFWMDWWPNLCFIWSSRHVENISDGGKNIISFSDSPGKTWSNVFLIFTPEIKNNIFPKSCQMQCIHQKTSRRSTGHFLVYFGSSSGKVWNPKLVVDWREGRDWWNLCTCFLFTVVWEDAFSLLERWDMLLPSRGSCHRFSNIQLALSYGFEVFVHHVVLVQGDDHSHHLSFI